jgi:hypothetical protein
MCSCPRIPSSPLLDGDVLVSHAAFSHAGYATEAPRPRPAAAPGGTRRISSTSMSKSTGLNGIASAPATVATRRCSAVVSPVKTTTLAGKGLEILMRRINSSPFIRGIRKSTTTTSGLSWGRRARASSPGHGCCHLELGLETLPQHVQHGGVVIHHQHHRSS